MNVTAIKISLVFISKRNIFISNIVFTTRHLGETVLNIQMSGRLAFRVPGFLKFFEKEIFDYINYIRREGHIIKLFYLRYVEFNFKLLLLIK
jgi:hypothetical protein